MKNSSRCLALAAAFSIIGDPIAAAMQSGVIFEPLPLEWRELGRPLAIMIGLACFGAWIAERLRVAEAAALQKPPRATD